MKYLLEDDDIIEAKIAYKSVFEKGKPVDVYQECQDLAILHKTNDQARVHLPHGCAVGYMNRYLIENVGVFISVPKFPQEMSLTIHCSSTGVCRYTLYDHDEILLSEKDVSLEKLKDVIRHYSTNFDFSIEA